MKSVRDRLGVRCAGTGSHIAWGIVRPKLGKSVHGLAVKRLGAVVTFRTDNLRQELVNEICETNFT